MAKIFGLVAAVVCMLGAAGGARAADQVRYAPPEAWVRPIPIPSGDLPDEGGGSQLLLQNDQARFGPEGDAFFGERVIKLLTPQSLQGANIIQAWNPETETLTVHAVHIIRGGKVIDVLAGGKTLTVLRRETNLEAASLDGALTATIQPEGLQVGDALDVSITLLRKDPLRQGRSESFGALTHAGAAGRIYLRELWPDSKPIRWKARPGLPEPVVTHAGEQTELVVDARDIRAPKPPKDAPLRFRMLGQLETTQFKDWAEIATIMEPLYRKAAALAADSPLHAQIARIKAASPDARERAFLALKLVEDQTRYVFLGMNLGGYLPADADVTWSRRFGDCKGKTALLLALLHELGVEAEPAFVNASGAGDGMDQRLPVLAGFDHVLVRAHVDGRVYWLDGTRQGDRNLDDIPPPGFEWALPIQAAGAQLTRIVETAYEAPHTENIVKLDASAGLTVPAKAHLETVLRGDEAIISHLAFDQVGQADRDRGLRQYWSGKYPWIKAMAVGAAYDAKTGVMRLWLDGEGTMDWRAQQTLRDYQIDESGLGGEQDFQREPGPNQDAPFVVGFPFFERSAVTISLPGKGAGFQLLNARPVNTTVGGTTYSRVATLKDGVVSMQADVRTLQSDFPAADAPAVAAALRELGSSYVFVRAAVGVDAPSAEADPAPAAGPGPETATGLAARGAGDLAAGRLDQAVEAFTRAMALSPGSAEYAYDRAVAYFQKGQDKLALADFDQALKLSPGYGLALMGRARLELFDGDPAGARRDFDQALKASPGDKGLLRQRADAYDDAGLWEAAIGYYADWLKAFPKDEAGEAVRGRLCLAGARLGRNPAAVLGDCEAVLKAASQSRAGLEGRAISLIRLGRFAEAIGAYDLLAGLEDRSAAAVYGRGIARIRAGQRPAGEADLKAGLGLDPQVAADFKRYGLAP